MTAGELAIVVGTVLCAIGFAALIVVLMRVLDMLRALRSEVESLRNETRPLLAEMQVTTDQARAAMVAARDDLDRFDRVLGSAEAISGAVAGSGRVARRAVDTGDQGGWHRDRHGTSMEASPPQRDRRDGDHEDERTSAMMKRVTWFVSGAIAGVAGASYTKKKVKATASQLAPGNIAKTAVARVKHKGHDVIDAVRDGRDAMKEKEAELRARLGGDGNDDSDEPTTIEAVATEAVPVTPGQVIVLQQVRDNEINGPRRTSRRGRRGP